MRCECMGEVMEYRIATEAGVIDCRVSGTKCPYRAGDYILTLKHPLTGETCESVLTPSMFRSACKDIA
jgi:hypothetical protein